MAEFTDAGFDFDEEYFSFDKTAELDFAQSAQDHPGHKIGLFEGISNTDYHAGPGISSSQLKYAAKAMRLYKACIDGELKKPESDALELGTAVHKLVLEAKDFSKEIVIWKKPDLRTKAGRQERDEFFEANKNMTILTPDQFDQCRFMRDSLMEDPEVKETGIFDTGAPELSGYYRDPVTGLLCRYRPDWRTDWCIADVKTARDVSEAGFSKAIDKMGYHVSASHYLTGDNILMGTEHRQFIFLCVEPESPYLAAVYVLGEQTLELGEWYRRKALDGICESRKTDFWPGVNKGKAKIIEAPRYAFSDMQREEV